jgi:hypothetical protein
MEGCEFDDDVMTLTLLQRVFRRDLLQIHPNLLVFDLWVIDDNIGVLIHEMFDQCDGGRLASVPGVGLECKAKNCNFLINGVRSLKKLSWPYIMHTFPVIVLKRVSTTRLVKRLF